MDDVDIFEYFDIVWRRRWFVAGLAFILAFVVAIMLVILPRTYRGRAVLIFPKTDQSSASGMLARLAGASLLPDIGLSGGNGPGMYAEILKSRTIADQVIKDLQLSSVDVNYEKLQKLLQVSVSKDGGMEVCCYAPTSWAKTGKLRWLDSRMPGKGAGEKTALLASEMVNSYIRHLQAFDREHSINTSHRNRVFLEGEVEKTRRELADAENALRRFKESHPVLPPPDSASQQMEQVINLKTKLIEAETELRESDEAIKEAETVIAGQEEILQFAHVIQQNPVVTELKAELARAEVKRAELLEDMTDAHPEVVTATQGIEKIRQKIEQEVPKVVSSETMQLNPVRQLIVQDLAGLEIKRHGLQARLDTLGSVMESIEREISGMARDQMRFVQLARDAKALELVYTSLLTQLSQAKVAEAREPEDFTVLDWSSPEKRHFKPKLKLTVIGAFMIGGLLGCFISLVQEARRPKKPKHAAVQ